MLDRNEVLEEIPSQLKEMFLQISNTWIYNGYPYPADVPLYL